MGLAYCLHPGCSRKVTSGRCPDHQRPVTAYERRFKTGATSYQRARWLHLRDRFRLEHPYCANPTFDAACTLTTDVVDHIIEHRGDETLMYDQSNLQPLCYHCHGVKTGKELWQNRR